MHVSKPRDISKYLSTTVLVAAVRTVRRSKTRFPRGSGARSGRARERGHFPVRRRTARVSSAGDTVPRHAIGRCDNFVELGTEEMAKLRRGRSIARALDAVLQWQYPGGGRDGLLTQFAGVGCGPQCFRAAETFAAMATTVTVAGRGNGGRRQDQNLRPRN